MGSVDGTRRTRESQGIRIRINKYLIRSVSSSLDSTSRGARSHGCMPVSRRAGDRGQEPRLATRSGSLPRYARAAAAAARTAAASIPSADGSVQLRLDGIDTPETHYDGLAQPLGELGAATSCSRWCGFSDVQLAAASRSARPSPTRSPRPVLSRWRTRTAARSSLLLVGDDLPADGATTAARRPAAAAANLALAASGAAYGDVLRRRPTRRSARPLLAAAARGARRRARRLGASTPAGGFDAALAGARSASAGALILPKLFRRCSDYLRTGDARRDAAGVAAPPARPSPNPPRRRGASCDGEPRHLSDRAAPGRSPAIVADRRIRSTSCSWTSRTARRGVT